MIKIITAMMMKIMTRVILMVAMIIIIVDDKNKHVLSQYQNMEYDIAKRNNRLYIHKKK